MADGLAELVARSRAMALVYGTGCLQGGVTGGKAPTGDAGLDSLWSLALGDEQSAPLGVHGSAASLRYSKLNVLGPRAERDPRPCAGVGSLGGSVVEPAGDGCSGVAPTRRDERRDGRAVVLAEVGLAGFGTAASLSNEIVSGTWCTASAFTLAWAAAAASFSFFTFEITSERRPSHSEAWKIDLMLLRIASMSLHFLSAFEVATISAKLPL